MPPNARTPRNRWIEAGLEALARGGPDAVRVEVLAAEIGVTKGGFYGYFDGRPELLAEVLDEWERRWTNVILEQIESEGGDPADKIRRAGQLSCGYWGCMQSTIAVLDRAAHNAHLDQQGITGSLLDERLVRTENWKRSDLSSLAVYLPVA